jgi:type IV secretory pathway VirJ component
MNKITLCGVSLLLAALLAPSLAGSTVADLPLIEVKPQKWVGDTFVVLISGDGGWAQFDRHVSGFWADRGLGTVGLNARKYFWNQRRPDEAAGALGLILDHYSAAWAKGSVILVGYSRGASVVPFMAARLRPDLLARVRLIALLGPFTDEDFEIHLSDFLGSSHHAGALPLMPEMEKLKDKKVLCVYGEEEEESLCRLLHLPNARVVEFPGGHHLGRKYDDVARLILDEGLGSVPIPVR